MPPSMADGCKEDLATSVVRAALPCCRCLDALARGEITKSKAGCIVSTNVDL